MLERVKGAVGSLIHGMLTLPAALRGEDHREQTVALRGLGGRWVPVIVYIGCTCGREFYVHPEVRCDVARSFLEE